MKNSQLVCFTGVVLLATLSLGYNFNDPVFNDYLANDLEELHEDFLNYQPHNVRNRRDEEAAIQPDKCKMRRKKACCMEETIEKLHEEEREIKRTCFREVVGSDKREDRHHGEFDPFRCDKIEKHRKEMTCVLKCVGQKKEVLDSEGIPIPEKVASFTKEKFGKEAWFTEEIQAKVVETCLAEAKNATATMDAAPAAADSCNPAGIKLVHCMFRETQLQCPEDQIKDQKSCARLQERLNKNKDFFPGPQALGDDSDLEQ